MLVAPVLSGMSWHAAASAPPAGAAARGAGCRAGQRSAPAGFDAAERVELRLPSSGDERLDPHVQQRVAELRQRDAEVREHEAAHVSVGGPYVRGGVQYEYVTGPDGRRYAVAGEVQIDTSPIEDDPAATIRKMQTVQAAALAPRDPSAQDLRVAAEAASKMQQAQAELARRQMEEMGGGADTQVYHVGRRGSGAYTQAGRQVADGTACEPCYLDLCA